MARVSGVTAAALKAAAVTPEIRAIAADSVYPAPADFLNYRILEDFGTENRFVQIGCYQLFRLIHLRGSFSSGARIPLQSLTDKSLLFIKGENRERLGIGTTQIYEAITPRKELIAFKTSRIHLMGGDAMKDYDRQVANFFQLNLK